MGRVFMASRRSADQTTPALYSILSLELQARNFAVRFAGRGSSWYEKFCYFASIM
jgi:hypothetical protein